MSIKNAAQIRRDNIKGELWPEEIAWTGEKPEKGWFRAPRTLPLVLMLLSDKKLSGTADLGRVYLELLARHWDAGVIEMASPGEHSYAAGYAGRRGVRSWQERMKLLEELGFIKSRSGGNLQYKYVLLVHPTVAIQALHEDDKLPKAWWDNYRMRQMEATEAPYEKLMERFKPVKVKVVSIKAAKAKRAKRTS
jgi:hypothetical protein